MLFTGVLSSTLHNQDQSLLPPKLPSTFVTPPHRHTPYKTSPTSKSSASGEFVASPLLVSDHYFLLSGYLNLPTIYSLSGLGFALHDSKRVAVPGMDRCSIDMEEFDVLPNPNSIRFSAVEETITLPAGGAPDFVISPVASFRPPLQPNPVYHFLMNCTFTQSSDVDKDLRELNSSLYFEWTESQDDTESHSFEKHFTIELVKPSLPRNPLNFNATSTELFGFDEREKVRATGTSLLLREHSLINNDVITKVQLTPFSLWTPAAITWLHYPQLQQCTINGYRIDPNSITYNYFNYDDSQAEKMISGISIGLTTLQSRYMFATAQPIAFECNLFAWTTNGRTAEYRIGAMALIFTMSFYSSGDEIKSSQILTINSVGKAVPFPQLITPTSSLQTLTPTRSFINGIMFDLRSFAEMAELPSYDNLFLTQSIVNCLGKQNIYHDVWFIDRWTDHTPDNLVQTLLMGLQLSIDEPSSTIGTKIDLTTHLGKGHSQRMLSRGQFYCDKYHIDTAPTPIITTLTAQASLFTTGDSKVTVTRHAVANIHNFNPFVGAEIGGRGDMIDPLEPVVTIRLNDILLPRSVGDKITIYDYNGDIQVDNENLESYQVEIVAEFMSTSTFSGLFSCTAHEIGASPSSSSYSSSFSSPLPFLSNVAVPVTIHYLKNSDDANFNGTVDPVHVVKEISHELQLKFSFDFLPFLNYTQSLSSSLGIQTHQQHHLDQLHEHGADQPLNIVISCVDSWIDFPSPSTLHTHDDVLRLSARVIVNGKTNDLIYKATQHFYTYDTIPSRMFKGPQFLIVVIVLATTAVAIGICTGCFCCNGCRCKKTVPSGTFASRFYIPANNINSYSTTNAYKNDDQGQYSKPMPGQLYIPPHPIVTEHL